MQINGANSDIEAMRKQVTLGEITSSIVISIMLAWGMFFQSRLSEVEGLAKDDGDGDDGDGGGDDSVGLRALRKIS